MSFRHWQVGERDAFLGLLILRTAWNKVKPSKQREVVIQTTGGLRSQIRDREITQRLVNCSKLPQLLGHNKEKQSPWGRGPCHQRAAGNKADLFCRAGTPEDTAWDTETPRLVSSSTLQCLPMAKRSQKWVWKRKTARPTSVSRAEPENDKEAVKTMENMCHLIMGGIPWSSKGYDVWNVLSTHLWARLLYQVSRITRSTNSLSSALSTKSIVKSCCLYLFNNSWISSHIFPTVTTQFQAISVSCWTTAITSNYLPASIPIQATFQSALHNESCPSL